MEQVLPTLLIHKIKSDNIGVEISKFAGTRLLVIVDDSCSFYLEEKLFQPEVGDIFLLKAGQCLSLSDQECSSFTYFIVTFNSINVPFPPLHKNEKWSLHHKTEVFRLLRELENIKPLEELLNFYKYESLCFQLLYELQLEMEKQAKEYSIQTVVTYMERNYERDISIQELAQQVNMSPSSFSKAFKKAYHMSPNQFLTSIRIEKAKQLLSPAVPLKDVASSVGYQDEFYFSRVFKKLEGISPSIFVKQNGQRVAILSQMFLQDHLLSLGVQPVAAPSYPAFFNENHGMPKYLTKHLKGTKSINVEKDVDYSDILRVSPDLIIEMKLHHAIQNQENLDTQTLSLQHYENWDQYLQKIAHVLQLENKVESVLDEVQQLELETRNTLSPITIKGDWAIVWVRENEIRLYGRNGHAVSELFYRSLDFHPHSSLTHKGYITIDTETLALMNPDHILCLWTVPHLFYLFKQKLIRLSVPAALNGNIYCPNSQEWDPWGPFGRKHMLKACSSYFESFY